MAKKQRPTSSVGKFDAEAALVRIRAKRKNRTSCKTCNHAEAAPAVKALADRLTETGEEFTCTEIRDTVIYHCKQIAEEKQDPGCDYWVSMDAFRSHLRNCLDFNYAGRKAVR
jgi:hypothetical protein